MNRSIYFPLPEAKVIVFSPKWCQLIIGVLRGNVVVVVVVPGGGMSVAFIPGGGTMLPTGDQPGDPFATLIVISMDGLLGEQQTSKPKALPPPVEAALEAARRLVDGAERSVVAIAGGAVMTQVGMEEMVRRQPKGLDAFGRGRKIEALVKERSAEWANLWESTLLVKMVAKRQCALVRFGSVAVITSVALEPATMRAYSKIFEDWRLLEDGGACRGGRDLPIPIHIKPIVTTEPGLAVRAATFDDRWFDNGQQIYARHPQWPLSAVAPVPIAYQQVPDTPPESTTSEDNTAHPPWLTALGPALVSHIAAALADNQHELADNQGIRTRLSAAGLSGLADVVIAGRPPRP